MQRHEEKYREIQRKEDMQRYPHDFMRNAKKLRNMQRNADTCREMQRCSDKCRGIQRSA